MNSTEIFDYDAQPKENVTDCNLCGGRSGLFTLAAAQDRYGYRVSAVECPCGLVFLSPRMTADAYAKLYKGPYRKLVSAFHGREINAETIETEQAEYAARLIESLLPHIDENSYSEDPMFEGRRVIDLGGSTGVVAAAIASRFGMHGAVLDPAPAELEHARRRGLETRLGTLESYEPDGREWDIVLLCQTVDHLLDIRGALDKANELLVRERDSVLWVDIVDYGRKPEIKIDHPYYLTPSTMGSYLRRAGFEVKSVEPSPDGVHVGFVCEVK